MAGVWRDRGRLPKSSIEGRGRGVVKAGQGAGLIRSGLLKGLERAWT